MLQKNWFMLLAVLIPSYGWTWEVWRALALKKLELLSAIASSNSYAFFVLSKLPACIHTGNSIYAHLKLFTGFKIWLDCAQFPYTITPIHWAILQIVQSVSQSVNQSINQSIYLTWSVRLAKKLIYRSENLDRLLCWTGVGDHDCI